MEEVIRLQKRRMDLVQCGCGALMTAILMMVFQSITSQAQTASGNLVQGGTLTFKADGKLARDGSTYVETIGLTGYVGKPLKALQLRVLSRGGLKLRSVQRGPSIGNSAEWNMSHVIAHGKKGVDTAKVVLFGLGTNTLSSGQHSELLIVTYDVNSSKDATTATLSLVDVLGALTHGENANITTGPQQVVSLSKDRRK